jgi:uncharacterized protein (DUF736 family)
MGLAKVGKCWKKLDKRERTYLSARIDKTIDENSVIFIFKNDEKPYETSPDYTIYVKDD